MLFYSNHRSREYIFELYISKLTLDFIYTIFASVSHDMPKQQKWAASFCTFLAEMTNVGNQVCRPGTLPSCLFVCESRE